MPNAKDAKGIAYHNVMLIGPPGSGKTTQAWTLPGKGFAYIFDPNALASLEGLDLEYETFSPDMLDINVKPLSSKATPDAIINVGEPTAYTKWEADFEERYYDKYFDQFDWIWLDSFTTFSDSVMDRVQWLNKRSGKHPEQADWTAQMVTIQNVTRTIASMNKLFIAICHDEVRQDERTGRLFYQPVLTGRLRTRIPLLFSNILRCEAESGKEGVTFLFHTASDSLHQYVRSSKAVADAVDPEMDVTIEDFSKPTQYGLGAILKKAGLLTGPASPTTKAKPSKKRSKK